MALETGSYINDLVTTNPTGTDQVSVGDDHIRLIKTAVKGSFPNSDRAFYIPDVITKNANYTVLTTEENRVVVADGTSSSVQISLPASSLTAALAGWRVAVFASNVSNAVTVVADDASNINGVATITLEKQYQFETFVWDGSAFIREGAELGDLAYLDTLANNSVTTDMLQANSVTLAKLATQSAHSLLGNITGSAAVPTAVAHGDLTNVASDFDDEVVVFDDSDSEALKKSSLRQIGELLRGPDLIYEHQETAGTNAGNTTLGAWRNRRLNTEVRDVEGIGSITGSGDAQRPSLPAGTYYVRWWATMYASGGCMTRLINSALTPLVYSNSGYCSSSDGVSVPSHGEGVLTLAGADTLQLQYQCEVSQTNGLGIDAGAGVTERYARLEIWRLST